MRACVRAFRCVCVWVGVHVCVSVSACVRALGVCVGWRVCVYGVHVSRVEF